MYKEIWVTRVEKEKESWMSWENEEGIHAHHEPYPQNKTAYGSIVEFIIRFRSITPQMIEKPARYFKQQATHNFIYLDYRYV